MVYSFGWCWLISHSEIPNKRDKGTNIKFVLSELVARMMGRGGAGMSLKLAKKGKICLK